MPIDAATDDADAGTDVTNINKILRYEDIKILRVKTFYFPWYPVSEYLISIVNLKIYSSTTTVPVWAALS